MRPWRPWRAIRRTWESWPGRRPSPDTQSFTVTAPKGWRQRPVLRLGPSGCCSVAPCDCSIDAAFDSPQRSRISARLEVGGLQEILYPHGEPKGSETGATATDGG